MNRALKSARATVGRWVYGDTRKAEELKKLGEILQDRASKVDVALLKRQEMRTKEVEAKMEQAHEVFLQHKRDFVSIISFPIQISPLSG